MQPLARLMQRLLPWLFAILLLITVVGFPASAQQSSTSRTLAIAGHGRAQAPTALAQITLGIADKGDTAKATYAQVNQRSSAIVKLLKDRKIDSVKTSNVNLTVKSDRDGKPKKDSYDGYRNVEFQVPADQMDVLDAAIAAGIDRVNDIRYIASEDDIRTARKTALENAISDAQTQAKVALDKLGFSTQDVIDIQVGDVQVKTPKTKPESRDSYSSWSENLPILDGGEQTVDVNVTLTIRY